MKLPYTNMKLPRMQLPNMELHRSRIGYDRPLIALAAFGLGAALMYFLDPVSGRRRREAVRDQAAHAGERVSATAQDLGNRAYGVVEDTKAALRPRSTSMPDSSASPMMK